MHAQIRSSAMGVAMIRLLGNKKSLCRGWTRRDVLQIGGLGAFGLALDQIAAGAAASQTPASIGGKFGRAKSCILIYKYGSPGQHETFDPKPQAPAEIQGELKAIATSVPGLEIGEGLPRIASIADRLTIVRSLTHPYPLHGTVYATTGIADVDTKIEAQPRHKRQWPFFGSLVSYLDEYNSRARGSSITNVALPFVMGSKNEYPPLAGLYGAMLGQRYDPVYTDFSPAGAVMSPEITAGKAFRDPYQSIAENDRLELGGASSARISNDVALRQSLLEQFDRTRHDLDTNERVAAWSAQRQMALSLLTSGKVRSAIDFTREPANVREGYGMTLFGQSCLAARRLIEAECRFVTVIWDAYGLNAGSWDTHHNHFPRMKEFLLPVFDQAFSALILDLEARGLLDETLVLVLSEHGRTPQIDSKPPGAGRHHWSRAYSQVYAGGGMAKGNVVGRSDKHASDVEETPISPKDVLATAFYLLGIDPESTFPDPQGRPLPIAGEGRFRRELLGAA